MERKVGEIFEHNGEWYQCVEGVDTTNCSDCDIQRYCIRVKPKDVGQCLQWRSDKNKAIFKKLKKVGEPYMSDGHLMQTLSGEKQPNSIRDYKTRMCYYSNCFLRIEIKQYKEKEYMEEKKLNLKPFDLEAAKEGKPVCTRDGRKARIICFDRKDNTPIVALIERVDGIEILQCFYNDGKCFHDSTSDNDLMILIEKKEGWVNVYREESNNNERLMEPTIYKTRKDAFDNACPKGYITTTKINWEE